MSGHVKWLSLFAALVFLINALALVLLGASLGISADIVRWGVFVVVGTDLVTFMLIFLLWKPTAVKQKPRTVCPVVKKSPNTTKGVTS